MTETTKGVLAALGAYLIWGVAPIFWKELSHVPPLEVFSHRTIWSGVLFGALVAYQGRLGEIRSLFADPSSRWRVIGAAAMVSINWLFFIYAIQVGKALEASLGYYIFPLVAVVLGYVVLRQKLLTLQWVAVGLAAVAVLYLTVRLGAAPWIALLLAVSFGLYGLIKSRLDAGPVISVTSEVLLIAPLSVIWLLGLHLGGWSDFTGRAGGYFGTNWHDSIFLIIAGLVTALPLILFSYASRRVSYATVGVLQYLNPSLQMLIAILIFAEPLTRAHLVALPLIWTALILYTIALRKRA